MRRCAAPVRAAPRSCTTKAASIRTATVSQRSAHTTAINNANRASTKHSPFFILPRRRYGQAVTTPDFRDYKRTTGLVGIPVIPPEKARQMFIMACERVLAELKIGIPESAAYRIGTEAIYSERVKIAQENPDPRDIERIVDMGQIEELIIQAEQELTLLPVLRADKPWEVPPGHRTRVTIREAPPQLKDKTGQLTKPPAAAPAAPPK